MQTRIASIALVVGIATVAAPIAFLGTYEWMPYALCLSVLGVAAAAALGYVQMVSKRRR